MNFYYFCYLDIQSINFIKNSWNAFILILHFSHTYSQLELIIILLQLYNYLHIDILNFYYFGSTLYYFFTLLSITLQSICYFFTNNIIKHKIIIFATFVCFFCILQIYYFSNKLCSIKMYIIYIIEQFLCLLCMNSIIK